MSAKNRAPNIKIRRLERALRKGRLRARLDLVQWARDHGHASTAGQARQLIIEDRIVSESHPVGKTILDLPDRGKVQVLEPLVPASLRRTLEVIDAKDVIRLSDGNRQPQHS